MVRHEISQRYIHLPTTEFAEIMKLAEDSKDIVSLGPGEPDFITPKHILDFIRKNLHKFTHYSTPQGRTSLREAIAKKLRKENKIDVDTDEIVVTAGSNEAIYVGLEATVDPGESVLVPNPGFLDYIPVIETLNGVPISIPLHESHGFELNMDVIKKHITPKTKVLIINTPSNPTGRILKKKTLEEIADVAVDKNLIIFSDEAYEKFVYGKTKHVSIASLNGMKNYVITFQTFSKTYAMPGFRVGYAAGPKDLINAMVRLHMHNTICAPTVSQAAAEFALRSTQKPVKRMFNEYNRRRKMIVKRVSEIPQFSCQEPEGAFYLFPNITQTKMNSVKFSHFILKKAKVLVVPGTEFGKFGEGYVRLSYATSYEKIEEATDRIERCLRKNNQ